MTYTICQYIINRLDRKNRVNQHLSRWPGYLSIALLIIEDQLTEAADMITELASTHRIIFTVYMIKKLTKPFLIRYDGSVVKMPPILPMNLLRDLCIESIETSHYIIVDVDLFPSGLII